ncbi:MULTISPECIES: hypothetical protein [Cupriavidus]|jgi:hypothetical protein|uniref:HEAT repeat domain-containing protein n=1 Tax=Cupriavidus metallidurans TaxID=119219 RepID=A0A482IXT3_9BURK|nr:MULTISPECIES: hypothetical protein [Cupriavidus]QBP12722.1 hypothetical protein DDF84_023870 [Cupriavidus metallidurans]QWC90508.1 hypothetical protein KB891_23490 [Cupriavidus metallidurans]
MIHSAEEFKRYVESDNEEEFLKSRDAASDYVWFDILSKYPDLARQVAFNNTISMSVLEKLSDSEDSEVRWNVATKRRINRLIFERLAHDSDSSIRHRIACNPKVPADILTQLASDDDELVAEAAKKRLKI